MGIQYLRWGGKYHQKISDDENHNTYYSRKGGPIETYELSRQSAKTQSSWTPDASPFPIPSKCRQYLRARISKEKWRHTWTLRKGMLSYFLHIHYRTPKIISHLKDRFKMHWIVWYRSKQHICLSNTNVRTMDSCRINPRTLGRNKIINTICRVERTYTLNKGCNWF